MLIGFARFSLAGYRASQGGVAKAA